MAKTIDLDLVRACRTGNLKRVTKLLDEGADPKRGHPSFSAPLVVAAGAGNAAVVELLLARGASIADDGAPAIEVAAGWTDDAGKAVFDLLVARGAVTTRSGKHGLGYSPLTTPIGLAINSVEGAFAGTRNTKDALAQLVVIERCLERLIAAGADLHGASTYGGQSYTPAERLRDIYASYGDEILASAPIKAICERIATLVVVSPVATKAPMNAAKRRVTSRR